MKKKRNIRLLAAFLLLAALLSGCGAAGSRDAGNPTTEPSENAADPKTPTAVLQPLLPTEGAAAPQAPAAVTAYPVDLQFTECASLAIPRDPAPAAQTPEDEQQDAEGIPGIVGKRPTVPAEDTYLAFRYYDSQQNSFRIQLREKENFGAVLTGTLYQWGLQWDEAENALTAQNETLAGALMGLEESQWMPCTESGAYAMDTSLICCLISGRNVIYADANLTHYQLQRYDDSAVLASVIPLAQGKRLLLEEGALSQIVWNGSTFPDLDIISQEVPSGQPEESPADDQLLAEYEEQLELLHQKVQRGTILVIVLGVVSAVLLVSNLICLFFASRRRKRPKQPDGRPTAAATGAGKAVKGYGIVHNIGRRSGQQDSFDVIDCAAGTLAVVADGMGGLSDGDKVSQKIVATIRADSARLHPGRTEGVLHQLIAHVNQEVNRMLGTANQYKCGSTLLSVLVERDTMQWATVGDSRIYLYRGGSLLQLNREHIYKADLLERAINGRISFAEAMRDPQLERLSSFIGMGELRHVDSSLSSVKVLPGDRILLMSDGVFNTLSNDEIAEVIRLAPSTADAATQLEQAVLGKQVPNQDNFTCVILEI